MKKHRFFAALLALAVLLALMAGCGSSSKNSIAMDTASAPSAGYYAANDSVATEEMSNGEIFKTEVQTEATSAIAPHDKANTKLIYNASLTLETTEFDSVTSALNALVSSMGGYFEQNNVNNYGSYRHGYYTVRVPAENFSSFCTQAGSLCSLTSINQLSTDVSELYYDVESRLTTQQTKLSRLQELLAKAESMEDIITIESAISETELQIEQLTGTLRQYDSLVGYSTVSITLDEVYKLSTVEEPVIGFGAKMAAAFKSGCTSFVNGLQSLLLSIARNWAGLLIFLAVAAAIILIILRVSRKRKLEEKKYEERRAEIEAQRAAEREERDKKKD